MPGRSVVFGRLGAEEAGPGVFARLPEVKPDDTVAVVRQDGTVVVFRVVSARWAGERARGGVRAFPDTRSRRAGGPRPSIKLVARGESSAPGSRSPAGDLVVRGDFAGWYRLPDFPGG
ncbi:hypothetical protein [Planomonospora corallina]|uniref:hypothetical protein n=1 Tax=Planomonospora corallina TaxID=1806052 RepID=UPI00367098DA